jgi:polyisoprenoid-binding protein YceI
MVRKMWIVPAVLAMATMASAADEYKIDPAHTSVTFSVRHMLVSNVPGRFKEVSGTIVLDEKDMTKSSVTAVIKVASITTDNEQRDNHLKSADFFDAEKFPEITFVSKKVEKRGDQWVATGELTMKGVTKQIEVPFEFTTVETPRGKVVGASATLKLNRMDYGVNWNRMLETGGAVVGHEVKIELNVEARSAAPPAPAKKS